MSAPFLFPLRYSRVLVWAINLAHLLPLLCLCLEGVPAWGRLLVTGGVFVSMLWQGRATQLLRHLSVSWSPSGEAVLRGPTGETQIEILADSIDLSWLIVLHWRELDSGRSRRAALTRDAFSAEHWRVLRRLFRWSVVQEDPLDHR